jgi:hypothetical protein
LTAAGAKNGTVPAKSFASTAFLSAATASWGVAAPYGFAVCASGAEPRIGTATSAVRIPIIDVR